MRYIVYMCEYYYYMNINLIRRVIVIVIIIDYLFIFENVTFRTKWTSFFIRKYSIRNHQGSNLHLTETTNPMKRSLQKSYRKIQKVY